jgi:hypothetical protein
LQANGVEDAASGNNPNNGSNIGIKPLRIKRFVVLILWPGIT